MKANTTSAAIMLARHTLKIRRQRDTAFGTRLFADPAWDMLLDLFVAHHAHEELSVSSLCVGSGVPQTTALRWIRTLEDNQLIVREADPRDARRVLIRLSDDALDVLSDLLGRAAQDLRQLFSTSIVMES